MTSGSWLSAHIQLNTPSVYSNEADAVVLDVVAPFLDRWRCSFLDGRFFFVRYSDDEGPHIRLRLLTAHRNARGKAEKLFSEVGLSPTTEGGARSDSAGGGIEGHYRWAQYEPETERYGGVAGVRVAEKLFHASSILALQSVCETRNDKSLRMGRALVATLLALHAFSDTEQEATRYAHAYWCIYLLAFAKRMSTEFDQLAEQFRSRLRNEMPIRATIVDRVWSELKVAGSLDPIYDAYRTALKDCRSQLTLLVGDGKLFLNGERVYDLAHGFRNLLVSYMHMTSNRLGLTLGEEAYLGYLIEVALQGGAPSPA